MNTGTTKEKFCSMRMNNVLQNRISTLRTLIAIASFCLLMPRLSVAQSNVGINIASPNRSAILDLTSNTQGFLTPRVTTPQRGLIPTTTGLLVYDNTFKGFYYYNGTIWTPFFSSSADWMTTGNSATSPASNFIGTTDAKDLIFKTNGAERYRLTSTGLLGVGTIAPTQKLEVHGNIKLDAVGGTASHFQFSTSSGVFSTTVQAGAQGTALSYTLPLAQGIANSVLATNGSGVLSWMSPSTFNWSRLGNTGSIAGTNFEGTKDNVDLVWKTNNVEGMRLTAAQNLGIGTNLPTSVLHTVASGSKSTDYTGNLLTNTATSSTASLVKYGTEVLSTGTWNGSSATNVGLHVNATGGTTNYSAIFEGGAIGVNTTTPKTDLDIAGDLATRYSSLTASNGTNNDVTVGQTSFVRVVGPTAPFSITGIAGGVDGKMLTLENSTSQPITISNESSSSSAANRISTLSNTGDLVINGKGVVDLIYSAADSRWIALSSSTTVSTTTTGSITVKKAADQSLTSTTLTDDSDLVIPIPANDSMQIEGYFDQKSASGGVDGKLAIALPSGATMNVYVFSAHINSITQNFLTTGGVSTTKPIDYNTNSTDENGILVFGTIVSGSTAGNIQVRWAQVSSASAPLTYKAGSYLEATYIRN